MATKRKVRKFAEGGFETAEGQNKAIDEGVRARAMRSVMPDDSPAGTSPYGEQNDLPETKTVTRTTVSKTPAVSTPKGETPAEYKERMDTLVKKQGIERVEPENYIPGPGLLKGMLKNAVRSGEKEVARSITTRAGKEIPIKQGNMKTTPPVKAGEYRNKSSKKVTVKRGEEGIADDGGSGAFKRGGSVSSASRRADGCAIRGKTRA